MFTTKQKIALAIGGTTGGFISDDEGFNTILGIAAGTYVGANWQFIEPKSIDTLTKHRLELDIDKVVVPDRVSEKLARFEKEVSSGKFSSSVPEPNKSKPLLPIDFDNLHETLNTTTLADVMANGSDEEKLRVMEYLRSRKGFVDVEGMSPVVSDPELSYSTVKGAVGLESGLNSDRTQPIIDYLRSRGYTDQEATDKANLMLSGLDSSEDLVIDRSNNTIRSSDGRKFEITSKVDGIDVYDAGDNLYANRKINIFGSYGALRSAERHALHTKVNPSDPTTPTHFERDVEQIIKSLDITDDKVKDVFRRNAMTWFTEGMLPEDLIALSQSSSVLRQHLGEIKEIASSAKEHLRYESGILRQGNKLSALIQTQGLRKYVSDISNITQTKETLNFNNRLEIRGVKDGESPFRKISTNKDGNSDNEFKRLLSFVEGETGVENAKTNVSINHYTSINLRNPKYSGLMFTAPAERTDPQRPTPMEQVDHPNLMEHEERIARSHRELIARGILPAELQSTMPFKTLSLDQDDFAAKVNRMNADGANVPHMLSDGFGIIRRSLNNQNVHRQTSREILTGPEGSVKVSSEIFDIVSNRELFNTDIASPITPKNYLKSVRATPDIKYLFSDVTAGSSLGLSKGEFKQLAMKIRELANNGVVTLEDASGASREVTDIRPILKHFADRFETERQSKLKDRNNGKLPPKYRASRFFQITRDKKQMTDIADKYNSAIEEISGVRKEALENIRDILEQAHGREGIYADLLDDIDSLIDNSTTLDREVLRRVDDRLKARNKSIEGRVRSPIIAKTDIHLDPNGVGQDVKLTSILTQSEVRLTNAVRVLEDDGSVSTILDFDSYSVSERGETFKIFGAGNKINVKSENHLGFDAVIGVAMEPHTLSDGTVLDSLFADMPGVTEGVHNVSVIAETGSTGQKDAINLYKIIAGTDVDFIRKEIIDVPVDTIQDSAVKDIANRWNKLGFSPELKNMFLDLIEEKQKGLKNPATQQEAYRDLWAITQMMTGLSEGKGTNNTMKGLLEGFGEAIEHAVDEALEGDFTRMSQFPDLPHTLITDLADAHSRGDDTFILNTLEQFRDTYYKKLGDVVAQYDHSVFVDNFFDGVYNSEEMFKYWRLAYPEVAVSWGGGYKQEHADAWGGSGGKAKSVSHFALQAMIDMGLDQDMMNLFTKADVNTVYDVSAFKALGEEMGERPTLNKLIDIMVEGDGDQVTKAKEIITDLLDKNSAPNEDYEILKNKIEGGVTNQNQRHRALTYLEELNKQPFLFYELASKDLESGVKTIALYRGDTNIGGRTKSSNKTILNTELRNTHEKVIKADLDFRDASVAEGDRLKGNTNPGSVRGILESASRELVTFYSNKLISENNPWLKEVNSRIAENSAFLKVVDSGDSKFNRLVDSNIDEGRSVVGISKRRAVDFLRGMGITIPDLDELEEYIGSDGLLKIDHASNPNARDAIFLNWREPSVSQFSIRGAKVAVLDDGITDTEIAISNKDIIYMKMMSGDWDDDKVYLAAPTERPSREQYEALNTLYETEADENKKLVRMAKHMGVKGSGTGYSYDLIEAYSEIRANPSRYGLTEAEANDINNPKTREQIRLFHVNRLQQGVLKAGERKITTPAVTKMVMDILHNPSFDISTEELGSSKAGIKFARLTGHYLVENLIKSSHTKTGEASPLDRLLNTHREFLRAPNEANRAAFVEQASAFIDEGVNQVKTAISSDVDAAELMKTVDEGAELTKRALRTMQAGALSTTLHSTSSIRKLISTQGSNVSVSELHKEIVAVYNGGSLTGNSPTLPLKQAGKDKMATNKAVAQSLKQTIIDNVKANSVPLSLAAGALALGSILFRSEPDFDKSNKISHGEATAMTLSPHDLTDDSNLLERLGRDKTAYITPPMDTSRFKERAIQAYGGYESIMEHQEEAMNRAIFGNNVSSVRIDRTYGY